MQEQCRALALDAATPTPDQARVPPSASLRAEIRDELAALERYEALHGSFPALVRAHDARDSSVGSQAD
jgi:hypothetical protein